MEKENAVLVGIELQKETIPLEESMAELERLAKTAGASVAAAITQKKEKPDLRYFIGKGKLEELLVLVKQYRANLIIFDNDLLASQQRNIEDQLGIKTISRTELILDIFAQHAHSHEGRLQVALAQAEFMMTRLSGKGISMSRLGGGIGTRGPGETKLESDRRKLRKTVSELKKELENLKKTRSVRRDLRKSSGIKNISIVGYTNSGKSTLLNALTKANVIVEDKLFATLDTTTRRLYLSEGEVLISDTVGFIQKLPHQLVDAFAATLEEVTQADILLHVTDASSLYLEDQINAVYNVLEEIGAISKPIITVFNKNDIARPDNYLELLKKYKPSISISALKKNGIDELKKAISCLIF